MPSEFDGGVLSLIEIGKVLGGDLRNSTQRRELVAVCVAVLIGTEIAD